MMLRVSRCMIQLVTSQKSLPRKLIPSNCIKLSSTRNSPLSSESKAIVEEQRDWIYWLKKSAISPALAIGLVTGFPDSSILGPAIAAAIAPSLPDVSVLIAAAIAPSLPDVSVLISGPPIKDPGALLRYALPIDNMCWDYLLNGTPTMFISGFLPESSKNGVSKTQSAGNQRHKSSLVGSSETTRSTTYPLSFCEWLAGIVDGDGSIQVSKKGYTSLEITMGFEDLRLLRYIQHMLGGSIKMRAGAKSYRYRLHNHLGMIKLMNCINGHIRHSARLLQLHRVCQVLEIPVILPIPLDAQSNWFAGFFDADGTITIDMKHGLPQLSIRVTNKLLQDVESYKELFGGSLYFDSSQNGYYQWSIQSRKDVIMMLDYFKSNTFRSHKSLRFFLIEEYYSLYDLEAFKPDSIHHKAWLVFLEKWKK
ncbi:hypothetical protein ACS0TY_028236 [Phlomoides rotata]